MADCRGEAFAYGSRLTSIPATFGLPVNTVSMANASPLRLCHVVRREGGNPVAQSVQRAKNYSGCPTRSERSGMTTGQLIIFKEDELAETRSIISAGRARMLQRLLTD